MLRMLALASLAGLAAVWMLYPLAVAALAARRRAAAPTGSAREEPVVSVIIAARDDDQAIQRRVADCLRAHYTPGRLEVIVAIDPTRPGSPSEALTFGDPRVRVVVGDAPGGKASTLNAGVRASRGDILVFTDTAQCFHPDAIRHLVAAFEDPRTGAASGCLELPPSGGTRTLVEWYWMYERWVRRSEARVHSSVGVSGSIAAVRRSLWAPLPAGLILDDLYTPMRVVFHGHRVAFAEAARATETRRVEPAREYRRKVRTLTGVLQLCAWLPAVLIPVRNPIWLQFVFHKLLRLLTPYWLLVLAAWSAVVTVGWLRSHVPLALGLALIVASAGYWARARVIRVVREGMLIQAAVVAATVNGLRGRWDVWR